MARSPQAVDRIGMAMATIPEPRNKSQEEIQSRKYRISESVLRGPQGMMVAEAIVDIYKGESVTLESDTHVLSITVTPK